MSKDYAPMMGDYVMIDVNSLAKSTHGTKRNAYIHLMEVRDAEHVWRVTGTAVDQETGDILYILNGARYFYKAEELTLIARAVPRVCDNKE